MGEVKITEEKFLEKAGLDDTLKIIKIFGDEFKTILAIAKQNQLTPLWMRIIIRTIFSWIDAQAYRTKVFILYVYESKGWRLSEKDKNFLLDKSKKDNASENVKHTLKLLASMMDSKNPDFSGKGWLSFTKAMDTRHSITHPKCSSDLNITKEKYDQGVEAFFWFRDHLMKIIESSPYNPNKK
ncbi:MAG: hypothetical protein ABIJ52_06950 [Pseudomonadota bacterium]